MRALCDGVAKEMPVLVAPHSAIGDTFSVTYTNSNGIANRVTPLHTMTTGNTANGTLLTTAPALPGALGPFMTLQAGDIGVQSIQSVQCTAGTDVGLFTLVLVYPIADMVVRESTSPSEKDFYLDGGGKLPVIVDDAYLNMIACGTGTLNGVPLLGDATFLWTL